MSDQLVKTGQEELKNRIAGGTGGECGVLVRVKEGRLIRVEEEPLLPRKVWPPERLPRNCLGLLTPP